MAGNSSPKMMHLFATKDSMLAIFGFLLCFFSLMFFCFVMLLATVMTVMAGDLSTHITASANVTTRFAMLTVTDCQKPAVMHSTVK